MERSPVEAGHRHRCIPSPSSGPELTSHDQKISAPESELPISDSASQGPSESVFDERYLYLRVSEFKLPDEILEPGSNSR